jgi:hypothetical protein
MTKPHWPLWLVGHFVVPHSSRDLIPTGLNLRRKGVSQVLFCGLLQRFAFGVGSETGGDPQLRRVGGGDGDCDRQSGQEGYFFSYHGYG